MLGLTWSCKRGAGNDHDHGDHDDDDRHHHDHHHDDDEHDDQKVIITYDETFWSNHKISKLQHLDFDKFGKITCPPPYPLKILCIVVLTNMLFRICRTPNLSKIGGRNFTLKTCLKTCNEIIKKHWLKKTLPPILRKFYLKNCTRTYKK